MDYQTLEITLQYAKDLNNLNLISKMNVYAAVSIAASGDESLKQKTPVNHGGHTNPIWDFPMKFTVDEAALQMNRLTLHFQLISKRFFGDKDIGEVFVPLKELLETPTKSACADGKHFVSYQVSMPSGKPKGHLHFSYQFGEKIAAVPFAPPPGNVDSDPVIECLSGPSSSHPPPAEPFMACHPPPACPVTEGNDHHPPAGGYPPPPPSEQGNPLQTGCGSPQALPMQESEKVNMVWEVIKGTVLGSALGVLLVNAIGVELLVGVICGGVIGVGVSVGVIPAEVVAGWISELMKALIAKGMRVSSIVI